MLKGLQLVIALFERTQSDVINTIDFSRKGVRARYKIKELRRRVTLDIALVSATAMHLAEGHVQHGKLGTIPDAFW